MTSQPEGGESTSMPEISGKAAKILGQKPTRPSLPLKAAKLLRSNPALLSLVPEELRLSGTMSKRGGSFTFYRRRFFRLFTSTLKYYMNEHARQPKGEIILKGAKLYFDPGHNDLFGFQITPKGSERTFFIKADNQRQFTKWVKTLKETEGIKCSCNVQGHKARNVSQLIQFYEGKTSEEIIREYEQRIMDLETRLDEALNGQRSQISDEYSYESRSYAASQDTDEKSMRSNSTLTKIEHNKERRRSERLHRPAASPARKDRQGRRKHHDPLLASPFETENEVPGPPTPGKGYLKPQQLSENVPPTGVPPPPGAGLVPPPPANDGMVPSPRETPPPPSPVPPPPALTGGVPPPPGGVPPPPGTMGVPPPPGGIPPPPGTGGGVPPPPGMGGVPPPPGGFFAPIAKKPSLPKKKSIKPKKKMKAFHWDKLGNTDAYTTIWKDLGKDDEKMLSKDDKMTIELAFSVVPKKKKLKKKSRVGADDIDLPDSFLKRKKRNKSPAKKKLVRLLDDKRRKAVEIVTRSLKLSGEEARDALLGMDHDAITTEKLQMLLVVCPTSEDTKVLGNYKGRLSSLDHAERFLKTLMEIPSLQTRLQLWLFKEDFDESMGVVREGVRAVNEALSQITTCKGLETVLKVILGVGNHINGGTSKGGAWGVKLSSLAKLKSVKSNDRKQNLLHFIVNLVRERYESSLKFLDDLKGVESAAQNDTAFLESEARRFANRVQQVGNIVKKGPCMEDDQFVPVMKAFHDMSASETKRLLEEAKSMTRVNEKLCKMYGEKPQRPEEFLEKFAIFVCDFRQAYLHVIERSKPGH
mmetsp:Transcript_21117/g.40940  ORF Transcript_21117/g.40940 Transcript_21117/m.40940 type:complete len:811 (-) Transcript_21117:202-2634(-)